MLADIPSCVVIDEHQVDSDVSDDDKESSCSRWEKPPLPYLPQMESPRKPQRRKSLRRKRDLKKKDHGSSSVDPNRAVVDQESPITPYESPRCPRRQASIDADKLPPHATTLPFNSMSLTLLLQHNKPVSLRRHQRRFTTGMTNARFSAVSSELSSRSSQRAMLREQDSFVVSKDVLPPQPRRVRSFSKGLAEHLQQAIDALHDS